MKYRYPGRTYYQKNTKYCTAYAITHLLEGVLWARFPKTYTRISPISVVWRGLRTQGLRKIFNRSMSVEEVQKGINKHGLTVKFGIKGETKTIKKVSFLGQYSPNRTIDDIAALLENRGPLVAYIGSSHTVLLIHYDKVQNKFHVLDSQMKKKKVSMRGGGLIRHIGSVYALEEIEIS